MTEVFKQSYNQLLTKQNKIEGEIKNFIKFKKYQHLLTEFSDLKKEYELMTSNSTKARNQVFEQVSALRQLTKTFKEKKERFVKGDNVKNDLKAHANTFSVKLKEFKKAQTDHYSVLCKEAEILENEIYVQEELLSHEIIQLTKTENNQPQSTTDIKSDPYIPNDDFEELLAEAITTKTWDDKYRLKTIITQLESRYVGNGGYNCGWHKAEQDDFLKLLVKHSNNPESQKFFNELLKCFPLYSLDELQAHVRTYTENRQITELKKNLLKMYKDLSRKKAEADVNDVVIEEEPKREVKLPDAKERLKMKAKVSNWRKERELEKFIKEQKERDKRDEEARKEREKLAQNAEQLKKIREDKMRRAKEKEILRQKEEELKKLQKPEFSPETLERIKQKEKDIVRRRSEALKRKKLDGLKKEELLNQINTKFKSKYAYVENRVDQYTESVLKKQTDKFDPKKHEAKYGDNFAGNLIRTTGKRLVEWRSGV